MMAFLPVVIMRVAPAPYISNPWGSGQVHNGRMTPTSSLPPTLLLLSLTNPTNHDPNDCRERYNNNNNNNIVPTTTRLGTTCNAHSSGCFAPL